MFSLEEQSCCCLFVLFCFVVVFIVAACTVATVNKLLKQVSYFQNVTIHRQQLLLGLDDRIFL